MGKITAIILSIFMVFGVFMMFGAFADDDDDREQDWARDAVLSGNAIPLAQIIDSIENSYDSTVFEVRLVKSDDDSVASMYRLKLVTDDGRLVDVLVDTLTGIPVGIGGKGIDGGDDDTYESDD